MSSENPSETAGLSPDQILFSKRVERAERFLRDVQSDMNSYHNHKENLAHASIAVMGGLAGGILIMETWPPQWVNCHYFFPNCRTFFVFFILWGLIHIYMRWQLRQRRSAAIMYNAACRILKEWIQKAPIPADFDRSPSQESGFDRAHFGLDDFFVVWKGVRIKDNAKYYPDWLMAKYEEERNELSIPAEWIFTLASFGLLFLVCLRTIDLFWALIIFGVVVGAQILIYFLVPRPKRNSP